MSHNLLTCVCTYSVVELNMSKSTNPSAPRLLSSLSTTEKREARGLLLLHSIHLLIKKFMKKQIIVILTSLSRTSITSCKKIAYSKSVRMRTKYFYSNFFYAHSVYLKMLSPKSWDGTTTASQLKSSMIRSMHILNLA